MKQKLLFLAIVSIFCFASSSLYAEEVKTEAPQKKAAPTISFEKKSYTFPMTIEGKEVIHDFIVKNTGDTPLKIFSVKPG